MKMYVWEINMVNFDWNFEVKVLPLVINIVVVNGGEGVETSSSHRLSIVWTEYSDSDLFQEPLDLIS